MNFLQTVKLYNTGELTTMMQRHKIYFCPIFHSHSPLGVKYFIIQKLWHYCIDAFYRKYL